MPRDQYGKDLPVSSGLPSCDVLTPLLAAF
jgi:hypothetical protein